MLLLLYLKGRQTRRTGNDIILPPVGHDTKGKVIRTPLCVFEYVFDIELSCGRARQETTDNVATGERERERQKGKATACAELSLWPMEKNKSLLGHQGSAVSGT